MDSRATNHMSHIDIGYDARNPPQGSKIHLPNGQTTDKSYWTCDFGKWPSAQRCITCAYMQV